MTGRSRFVVSLLWRPLAVASAVVFVASALVAGCKSHLGDACTTGQATCLDRKSGLFCSAGSKYEAMTCSGGCAISGRDITCDNSLAAEKDGCAQVGDVACSTDHKKALECGKDHAFVVGEACKGPRGCAINSKSIDCDNDMSDVGDPCHTPGDYACTEDKGLLLRCDDHKMTPVNSCRGPKACRIFELPQEKKIDFVCDDSLANENDPCDTNGEEACTMDKKAMYICRANKFIAYKTCEGALGCVHEERTDTYSCDEGAHAALASPAPNTKPGNAGPPSAPIHKKKAK